MTAQREQAIKTDLQNIVNAFVPTTDEPTLTMFVLISHYNATGKNTELIGGDWAKDHGLIFK